MTLTTADYTMMQGAQDDHMLDTCQVGTRVLTENAYGEAVVSFSYGDAVDCGFEPKSAEIRRADGTINATDAEVRLPIGTTIDATGSVKVTYRHGTDVTDVVYLVAGPPRRGASGLVVTLRLAE